MYRRKREIIRKTVAVVSYTDSTGKRHKEEKIGFNGVECYTVKHLYYTILKNFKQLEKPYVHEIVSTYYWEE